MVPLPHVLPARCCHNSQTLVLKPGVVELDTADDERQAVDVDGVD
jgi:hypothetical protein